MGAEFYKELVCQYSNKGENSSNKCRNTICKHHKCHAPKGYIEYFEWNPFGKNEKRKCPYYNIKAKMILLNNWRNKNES